MKTLSWRGASPLAALILGFLALAFPGHAQFEGWYENLGAAKAEARARRAPLLVLFVLEGCPECERMERSLQHPHARQALAPFAKAVLEFHAHRDVALRYGIEYTPTLLIYLPTATYSSCYARRVGALTPSAIARLAQRALAACRESPEKSEASKAPPQPAASEKPVATPSSPSPTWQYINQRWGAAASSHPASAAAPTLSDCYRELTRPPAAKPKRQARGRR